MKLDGAIFLGELPQTPRTPQTQEGQPWRMPGLAMMIARAQMRAFAERRPRYCSVGRSTCRNVSVLMSRNIGVRGGSRLGLRNSASNL